LVGGGELADPLPQRSEGRGVGGDRIIRGIPDGADGRGDSGVEPESTGQRHEVVEEHLTLPGRQLGGIAADKIL
jgi:hypothetical protein